MSWEHFVQMYDATTTRQQFQYLVFVSLIIAFPSTLVKELKEMTVAMRLCFHEFWMDLSKYKICWNLVSYS